MQKPTDNETSKPQDVKAGTKEYRLPHVSVENMKSVRSGRAVANQFIIITEDADYFQSCNTIIACVTHGHVYLDRDRWDYSRTIGKYRNKFLGESTEETKRKIKEGIYILVDLNR